MFVPLCLSTCFKWFVFSPCSNIDRERQAKVSSSGHVTCVSGTFRLYTGGCRPATRVCCARARRVYTLYIFLLVLGQWTDIILFLLDIPTCTRATNMHQNYRYLYLYKKYMIEFIWEILTKKKRLLPPWNLKLTNFWYAFTHTHCQFVWILLNSNIDNLCSCL